MRRFTILLTICMLLLVSCGTPQSPIGGTSSNNTPSPSPSFITPNASQPPASQPSGTVADAELERVVENVLEEAQQNEPAAQGSVPLSGAPAAQTEQDQFIQFVADNLDQYWAKNFAGTSVSYVTPNLVIWKTSDSIPVGTESQDPKGGPFYSSRNNTIYYPLPSLWKDIPIPDEVGDFAVAYIVAHEFGHHIQSVTGIWDEYTTRYMSYESETDKNHLNQQMELQADCLAGNWANSTYYQGILEAGDIDEAIKLATLIGDDNLGGGDHTQWTHGSGELRRSWFFYGYNTGKPSECNTWVDNQGGTTSTGSQQPAPASERAATPAQELQSFFYVPANYTCEELSDPNFPQVLITLRCNFSGFDADFDKWASDQDMSQYIKDWAAKHPEAVVDTWQDDASTTPLGDFIAFVDEGRAIVIWSVYGRAMTGTIVRPDGDLSQARSWWEQEGGRHFNQ